MEDLLNIRQAAIKLNVSIRSIYNLVKQGKLTAVHIKEGKGGITRYRKKDIDDLIMSSAKSVARPIIKKKKLEFQYHYEQSTAEGHPSASCETCAYFSKDFRKAERIGTCKRQPPSSSEVNIRSTLISIEEIRYMICNKMGVAWEFRNNDEAYADMERKTSSWPKVFIDDWCGEWRSNGGGGQRCEE